MQRRPFLTGGVAALLAGCAGGGGVATADGSPRPLPPLRSPLPALNFSPYLKGQNPERDPSVGASQLQERLAFVAPLTRRIRTYGCDAGLEQAPALARALGLQVSAGAWIDADAANNERQIAKLQAVGRAGHADVLVVGNEVLFRNELSATALAALVRRVKAALPALRIACAEVPSRWLSSPALVQAVDLLLVNAYPYWQGVAIDKAMASLDQDLQAVRAVAGGKPVQLSETGWPSAGNSIGAAVPSEVHAARYLADLIAWGAASGHTEWYWFAAFDEDWKTGAEGPQGAHWGLMTADGRLKPAFRPVLGA